MPGITFTPTFVVDGLPASGSTTGGASNALMRPALPLCPYVIGRPHARFQASPRLNARPAARKGDRKDAPRLPRGCGGRGGKSSDADGVRDKWSGPSTGSHVVHRSYKPPMTHGGGFRRGETSRKPGDHRLGTSRRPAAVTSSGQGSSAESGSGTSRRLGGERGRRLTKARRSTSPAPHEIAMAVSPARRESSATVTSARRGSPAATTRRLTKTRQPPPGASRKPGSHHPAPHENPAATTRRLTKARRPPVRRSARC
ncbi:hypothetical protein SCNRRL3882_3653 [Streptomyces chartreusis NRRL 3882]|uniref:Uncharacterized protein n=1 Tax=Streptomyces chartreusis NRRL 3882 TaxID=1079985 RepID=A0A2N9BA21_STRCX|nr:hypothetical protein SCNRRL3882_3653 [Streptomyces chartreusis NRRL 3882]